MIQEYLYDSMSGLLPWALSIVQFTSFFYLCAVLLFFHKYALMSVNKELYGWKKKVEEKLSLWGLTTWFYSLLAIILLTGFYRIPNYIWDICDNMYLPNTKGLIV